MIIFALMGMFSKSCEYGIKAMICISRYAAKGERIKIAELAKEIDAPEPFTAKILQELSRKNIVQSMKGPNGGFFLDKKHMKTSLAVIVKAIDGDSLYNDCVLGLKLCSHKTPCPVHNEYMEIKKNLIHMMESNTLGDIRESLDTNKFFLRNG